MLESTMQDIRYGIRQLRQSPGFTLVAVLSLALGIGANTAIFQLIDAIRLKMLPVHNPQELVSIDFRSEEHTSELQSHHDLVCRLLLEKKKNVTSAHSSCRHYV